MRSEICKSAYLFSISKRPHYNDFRSRARRVPEGFRLVRSAPPRQSILRARALPSPSRDNDGKQGTNDNERHTYNYDTSDSSRTGDPTPNRTLTHDAMAAR